MEKSRTLKKGDSRNRRYIGKKSQREIAVKKSLKRLAAVSLAVGIGIGASPSIIGNIANHVNNSRSTKEAIEMAASNEEFLNSINQDKIKQAVINAEKTIQLENFMQAVSTYKELNYKKDRTMQEEQQFIDSCRTICESKSLVIDTYTDIIKSKVAEAYGITDAEAISNISVKDYIHASTTELSHNVEIKLPDGTAIENKEILVKKDNSIMDTELENAVIEARALLDVDNSFDSQTLENLPIDEIIRTFEDGKEFDKNYKLSVKENGDLETIKIEQNKTAEAQKNQPIEIAKADQSKDIDEER